MTYVDLVHRRIRTQGLVRSSFKRPVDVVAWLGAVQAQDYAGATWAIGQRIPGLTVDEVDRAFDEGEILRTHVLRPTWHFLTPQDIRWILALSAPRVHQCNAFSYRTLELDAPLLRRARAIIERGLRDRQYRTRAEMQGLLAKAGIAASGLRLAYVMMHAELEALVTSGPRRGKQFTYALLDERAPHAKALAPDDALASLTRRYFTGHGPATVRDYVWWSGLTTAQARRGLEMVERDLTREEAVGKTYWSATPSTRGRHTRSALLLPNYDECLIAYKDRGTPRSGTSGAVRRDPFPHHLLIDGRLAGSWSRAIARDRIAIEIATYDALTKTEKAAVERAAGGYGRFMRLAARMTARAARDIPQRQS